MANPLINNTATQGVPKNTLNDFANFARSFRGNAEQEVMKIIKERGITPEQLRNYRLQVQLIQRALGR